jgi:hypothetical protein
MMPKAADVGTVGETITIQTIGKSHNRVDAHLDSLKTELSNVFISF